MVANATLLMALRHTSASLCALLRNDVGSIGLQPIQVYWWILGGSELRVIGIAHWNHLRPFCQHRVITPLFDLSMPVGKRYSAGTIVIRGRAINPIGDCRIADKRPVVNAPRIFVEEHPGLAGAHFRQI